MQLLTLRISVLGIFYVSNIQIFTGLCFFTVHAGDIVTPADAGVTIAPVLF